MKVLNAILILCVILCCKGGQLKSDNPQSYFITEFPKRAINLQNVFGMEFGIKSNNDTTYYTIEFQSQTRINLIKEKNSNDTIFFGKASRFRGLLYFSHQLKDSAWHIQAVKVEGNKITGFNSMLHQMFSIDDILGISYTDFTFDSIVQIKINKAILKITLDKEKPERLVPDKNSLKIIYPTILSNLKTDTIIDSYLDGMHETTYNIDQLTEEATVTDPESTIRLTLFPNPVNNQLNVKFNKPGKYSCEIINSTGAIVLKTILQKKENELNLADLKIGVYFLKISDNELNNVIQKFIKQ